MERQTAIVIGKHMLRNLNPILFNNHSTYIGAGAGGVAIAARLAKEGIKVNVVEKNDFIGGRCSLIQENGYVRPRLPLRCTTLQGNTNPSY